MTSLVTGGTGFVGSHLVDTLIARGERVKVLVRKTSKVDPLKEIGAELAIGDVTDPESVDLAMNGSDVVFHLAAALDWKPEKEQWSVNYLGTMNMLKAALKQKVQRFVHCSSVGVLDFANDPLDESSPYHPSPYSSYAITKCKAEKEARAHYSKGLPVVVVRPGAVYGPRDVGTMGLAFARIQKGSMPLIDGGKALLQPTYVQDVVDAMILATEKDKALGQVYNIAGGKILSFKQWCSIIAEAFGVDLPRRDLSKRVAWALGYLLEMKSRIFGGVPLLTRYRVECVTKNMIYDISKAREELGFNPTGIEEGVKRTVEWYRNSYGDPK